MSICHQLLNAHSVTEWRVESRRGDVVGLSEEDGFLRIAFDLDVSTHRQVAHEALKQGDFLLLRAEPVLLDEDQTRVCFDALGVCQGSPSVRLVPVVRDGSGKDFFYQPHPYPHLFSSSSNWSSWMTQFFYASEAGGASPDTFEVQCEDENTCPRGPFTFLGFQVQVRSSVCVRHSGELALGGVSVGGMTVPYSDPYLYVDSLLSDKGDFRIGVCISDSFQGLPVREFAVPLSYDPDSLRSRFQRLSFPLGPDGNYWIHYQITNSSGAVIGGDFFRWQVEGNTDRRPLASIDPVTEPELGYIRVNPDIHTEGVYQKDEPLEVSVRLFAKDADVLMLAWQLEPYVFPTPMEYGNRRVAFGGAPFVDVPIVLTGESGRDAYRLRLDVIRDGKTVDKRQYILGHETDLSTPYGNRGGKIVDRDQVKRSAYFRLTYLTTTDDKALPTEREAIAHFLEFLEQASQVTSHVTYMVDLATFEVLPGVYDLHLLDQVMDAAADYGCGVTVRVAHVESHWRFTWLRQSGQYSFDGTQITGLGYAPGLFYGTYAQSHKDYKACWLHAYRTLYQRYHTHPAFEGYYLMQPGGEYTVVDEPWKGTVAGYERVTLPVFRDYLRNTMELTLDQLNQRWGTACSCWEEVTPPLPDFELGASANLSLRWLDFCGFKVSLERSWFRSAAEYIRSFDEERIIIVYTTVPEELLGLADYMHNGGNQSLQWEGKFVAAWESGLGWITEPIHPLHWAAGGDPAGLGWVLDWSVFIMTAQAGGGGANLHVYHIDKPTFSLVAHYGGAYAFDRMERFKPVLRELQQMRVVDTPRQVATVYDPYTLYCKHRTVFFQRKDDLKRWFELLRLDSVDFEELRSDHLWQYKLLVPNIIDEVMSEENIRMLGELVGGGARMVMCANTGSFCPERGNEPFQLLRELGITAPVGPYVTYEMGVSAQVVEEDPIFAAGSKIDFYTLADLRRDAQSHPSRESFWRWPYRFIPQTDYFGYYPGITEVNGTTLARFPSGATALSLHRVGEGEVLVFWGTPDCSSETLRGMMARAAAWAGVENPRRGNPIPYMIEGHNDRLSRRYVILYHETPGEYRQRFPETPDGHWFIDDIVSGQRFGTYTGQELRDVGMDFTYETGASPLKIMRLMTLAEMGADWVGKYRQPEE